MELHLAIEDKPIMLRIDKIIWFEEDLQFTKIYITEGKWIRVKEKFNEIKEMLWQGN